MPTLFSNYEPKPAYYAVMEVGNEKEKKNLH